MTQDINVDPGHLSEFQTDPATGYRFNGTCGETALETAFAFCDIRPSSASDMIQITRDIQARGEAPANGSTTTRALYEEAVKRGYEVVQFWDYSGSFLSDHPDFHQFLLDHAGVHPIVLLFTNGQALVDAEVGISDERGLQGHFICILDKKPTGYIANDGDRWDVGQRFAVYSYQTLVNAQVSGLLALGPKKGQTVATSNVPNGWHDDGTVLYAPNGVRVQGGFRDLILAGGFDATNVPLDEEHGVDSVLRQDTRWGKGVIQHFRLDMAAWAPSPDPAVHQGSFLGFFPPEVMASELFQAEQAVSAEAAQINTLNGEINALNAQIAALKANPPAQSAPAPVDPSVKNALVAVANALGPEVDLATQVKAALATLG